MRVIIMVIAMMPALCYGQSIKGTAVYNSPVRSTAAIGSVVYIIDSSMVKDSIGMYGAMYLNSLDEMYRHSNLFEFQSKGQRGDKSLAKSYAKKKEENKDEYLRNDKMLKRFYGVTTLDEYKSFSGKSLSVAMGLNYEQNAQKAIVDGSGNFEFKCKPATYYLIIKPYDSRYGTYQGQKIRVESDQTKNISYSFNPIAI